MTEPEQRIRRLQGGCGSDGRFIGKASDRFIAVSESGSNYGEAPKSLQFKSLEDSDVKVMITIEER